MALESFDLSSLPPRLRFDGIMEGENRSFLQFTELDPESASYGASFYIDSLGAILSAVVQRREEKRQQFAGTPARTD